MFNLPFLYETELKPSNSKIAVIVLPEIFGVTEGVKEIADRFTAEFGIKSFALDYFYEITGEPNNFSYETGGAHGFELMKQTTAEKYNKIFNEAVDYIKNTFPEITEIVVCGFCFGGRLAYLSGLNPIVTKVISFYGGGATTTYFEGKSVVEQLAKQRKNDTELKILSFFGEQDSSIPLEDRDQVKNSLVNEGGLNYQEYIYPDAGHAYFNHKRAQYHKESADQSWAVIKEFLA